MHAAVLLLSLSVALPVLSHAQAADAGAWERLQQLPANSKLKISATQNGGTCLLQSVSADALVCAHGTSTRAIPRDSIKSIKLARRGRSAAEGLALGAAIGAGVGVGIGSAINSSDKGSYVHTSTAKSAGVGAAVGVLLGGIAGAGIGYGTDLFAGPTLYKR